MNDWPMAVRYTDLTSVCVSEYDRYYVIIICSIEGINLKGICEMNVRYNLYLINS